MQYLFEYLLLVDENWSQFIFSMLQINIILILLAQNYVGSVVKQCLDDGQDDDDDDDDGSDGVFGITTVINITKRKVSTHFII